LTCIVVASLSAVIAVAPQSGAQTPPVTAVVWEGSGYGTFTIDELQKIPYIQNNGRVALFGWITGPGVDSSNDGMALAWAEGALEQVCREGDPFLGAGPNVTITCSRGGVADPQRMFSIAALSGDGIDTTNDSVRVVYSSQSAQIVVREGDPAPDTGGVFGPVGTGTYRRVNAQGSVAFEDVILGGWSSVAIFSGSAASVSCFVQDNDPVSGLGGSWSYIGEPLLSPGGHVAFSGQTDEGGGVYSDGVWSGTVGGGPGFVAGTGTNDPGGGGFIDTIGAQSISRAGAVAMTGAVTSGLDGVWVGTQSQLRRVAFEGESAPGGGTFSAFSAAILNGVSEAALMAWTQQGRGIYLEVDGSLELVAREGDPAPGFGTGITFRELWTGPIVNLYGEVAFSATLEGPGITANVNDSTIWMRRRDGSLALVARQGGSLEIEPGISKTVTELFFGSSRKIFSIDNSGATLFNDLGELVFWAAFSDGTKGIFVSQPERFLCDPDLSGSRSGTDVVLVVGHLFGSDPPVASTDCEHDNAGDAADLAALIEIFEM
jgi:hypothetical protein